MTQELISPCLTFIDFNVFNGCSSITDISIPSSLTLKKTFAFSRCSSLKKVIIPSSVKSIEPYAFMKCYSSEDVAFDEPCLIDIIEKATFSLPISVISIKRDVFSHCSSLSSISIPSSVTKIDLLIFSHCTSLESVFLYHNLWLHLFIYGSQYSLEVFLKLNLILSFD